MVAHAYSSTDEQWCTEDIHRCVGAMRSPDYTFRGFAAHGAVSAVKVLDWIGACDRSLSKGTFAD